LADLNIEKKNHPVKYRRSRSRLAGFNGEKIESEVKIC